ncbi:hypothetical protein SMMN14_03752 [Sphaerulina musiva]
MQPAGPPFSLLVLCLIAVVTSTSGQSPRLAWRTRLISHQGLSRRVESEVPDAPLLSLATDTASQASISPCTTGECQANLGSSSIPSVQTDVIADILSAASGESTATLPQNDDPLPAGSTSASRVGEGSVSTLLADATAGTSVVQTHSGGQEDDGEATNSSPLDLVVNESFISPGAMSTASSPGLSFASTDQIFTAATMSAPAPEITEPPNALGVLFSALPSNVASSIASEFDIDTTLFLPIADSSTKSQSQSRITTFPSSTTAFSMTSTKATSSHDSTTFSMTSSKATSSHDSSISSTATQSTSTTSSTATQSSLTTSSTATQSTLTTSSFPSATSTETSPARGSSTKLSPGAIAGIAIGVAAGALCIILAACLLLRRRRRQGKPLFSAISRSSSAKSQRVYPEIAWLYDPPEPTPRRPSRHYQRGDSEMALLPTAYEGAAGQDNNNNNSPLLPPPQIPLLAQSDSSGSSSRSGRGRSARSSIQSVSRMGAIYEEIPSHAR